MKRPKKHARRYPWLEWFKKKKFVLVRGTHYDIQSYVMAQMIRNVARLPCHDVSVSIQISDDGTGLSVTVNPRE